MLFKTISELQACVEVNAGASWTALLPSIGGAERRFLIPAIGRELYDEMSEAYGAGSMSIAQATLLPFLQRAIAPLAMYLFVPRAAVQVSDSGINRIETTETKTAYKQQVLDLQQSFLDDGYNAIEELLDFLNRNAGDYPTYTGSQAYATANALLIRSGHELADFITTLRQPERVYQAMRGQIASAEDLSVDPVVGADFAALKAKDQAGTAGEDEKTVIRMLKIAVANYAMCRALLALQLRIDDGGVTVLGDRDNTRGADSNRSTAEASRIRAMADDCQALANQYLANACSYMDARATAALFPGRYALLQALAEQPEPENVNACMNGVFGL